MTADTDPITRALEAVLAASRNNDVGSVLPDLRKTAAIKRAFAPLARSVDHAHDPRQVMQRCLELPADEPIHQAAAGLLARGVVPGPVHVSVAPLPRPRCHVHTLLASRREPIVYAGEKGRISRWSIDTGELLSELPLPKKTATALALAELADGTLRVVTDGHEVLTLNPATGAFKRVAAFTVEGGKNRERFWMGSSDLRYHLIKPAFYPKDGANGPEYELHLYDVEAKKPRSLIVAGHPGDFIRLGPTRIGVPYDRTEGDDRVHELAAVDLATGERTVTRLPEDMDQLHPGSEGRALLFTSEHAPGQKAWFRLELADGKRTMLAPEEVEAPRNIPRELVPLYDGYRGGLVSTHEGEIRDRDGKVLAYYVEIPHMWHGLYDRHLLLPGPKPGWFIVSFGGPDSTVSVIAPYEPTRAVVAPAPAPLSPAPEWARPGTVLHYHTADYDAADNYRHRVVAADDGLTLQIDLMAGDEDDDEPQRPERVARALRFTAEALAAGDDPVLVAQGGVDVDDVDEPITDRLPPNMFARDAFARLAAGESVTFHHRWIDEPTTLQGSGELEGRTVAIDGQDVRVPSRVFTGDAATLVVLDDARWPLVLEVEAGDCHLRLTRMTLPRATSIAGSASGVRRFEMQEDGEGKFWEVAVDGSELRVRFGKLGTAGRVSIKALASPEAAAREAEKLVREKTNKGYQAA